MKKIALIVIAVILVILAALVYLNNRNRTLSPPGKAELTNGELAVSIPYSRPSVRNRVIFGTKEQGAIQPYGEYWRLGANEATEITLNRNVLFNGSPVSAGTYRMYAVPGAESFEIALNSELGVWGVFEPDPEKDVLKTSIPVEHLSQPIEQFTITLGAAGDTTTITFAWEKVKLVLPLIAN